MLMFFNLMGLCSGSWCGILFIVSRIMVIICVWYCKRMILVMRYISLVMLII